MRITKLHLLGLFLLCALAFSGHYYFKQQRNEMKMREEQVRLEIERKKSEEEAAEKSQAPKGGAAEAYSSTPSPAERLPVQYTVQRGDTLWKISKMPEHFGSGHRWYDIWKSNEDKILDFDHLEAGLILSIPLDAPENFAWAPTSDDRKNRIMKRLNPQARRAATN